MISWNWWIQGPELWLLGGSILVLTIFRDEFRGNDGKISNYVMGIIGWPILFFPDPDPDEEARLSG